jgi:hypothetical protein
MTTLQDRLLGPPIPKYRSRRATGLGVGLVLIALPLLLPRPSRAAWETIGDWKVTAADRLSVRRSDRAMAWNPAMTLGSVNVIVAAALCAGSSLTAVTKANQGEASKIDGAGRHDFHPGRQAP